AAGGRRAALLARSDDSRDRPAAAGPGRYREVSVALRSRVDPLADAGARRGGGSSMSDDLERRLSAWFAEDPATEPPERLRRFVARLPVDHARVPERRGSWLPLRRVAGGFRLVATLALA